MRLAMAAGAVLWVLGGCAWHHGQKAPSYDKSIGEDEQDPTYREDPQRAGEIIKDDSQ